MMRRIRLLPITVLIMLLSLSAAGIGYAEPSDVREPDSRMQAEGNYKDKTTADPVMLGEVVQEIVLRRQISAMGLDRDQIEKILPPLRSMLSSCRDFEKQMKDMFARERNRTATDETSKEKLQELRREAAEARKRFIRGQSELEREIGNVLSEEQSAAVKRMLYAPLLHDEALSSEDKERLRREVQEHRQNMALQECRKA